MECMLCGETFRQESKTEKRQSTLTLFLILVEMPCLVNLQEAMIGEKLQLVKNELVELSLEITGWSSRLHEKLPTILE